MQHICVHRNATDVNHHPESSTEALVTTKPKAKSASTAARATTRTSATAAKKRAPAKAAAAKTPTVKAAVTDSGQAAAAKATQTAAAEVEKAVAEAPKPTPAPEIPAEPAKAIAESKAAVVEATKKMDDAIADVEPLVQGNANAIVQGLEQAMLMAKQQAEKASLMATKSLEDVSLANKSTYDSWVKSGETLAKGLEDVSKSLLSYAQSSTEANVSAAKDMMSCTDVNELWALQSSHAKACFDGMLAEGTKISEMMAATLNDAFSQMGKQFKGQFEQAWKPLTF